MKTNFERVRLVLDQLDASARVTYGRSVDSDVDSRLKGLTNEFRGLLAATAPISYADPVTHLAYSFRCLSAHADLINRALMDAYPAGTELMQGSTLKVACLGGGPGSDVIGVLKFLGRIGKQSLPVKFDILDHQPAWEAVSSAVRETYTGERQIEISHSAFDYSAGPPWTSNAEFHLADLFTFSFSLSEAWAFNRQGSVSQFLDTLIGSAKDKSLFVYADNGGSNFEPHVAREFDSRSDLKLLAKRDIVEYQLIESDEQVHPHLTDYKARYCSSPKLRGTASYRVWQKV